MPTSALVVVHVSRVEKSLALISYSLKLETSKCVRILNKTVN